MAQTSFETLWTLAGSTPQPVVGIDHEGRICLFNESAEKTFGITAQEVLEQQPDQHPATAPLAALAARVHQQDQPVQQTLDLPSGAADVLVFAVQAANNRLPEQMREIVHELKSPIGSTKGFIDLIEATGPLNETQARWTARVRLSLASMHGLVHELLDMAWLEAGAALNRVPTDLRVLLRRAAAQLEGYAQGRSVVFHMELTPGPCELVGDERRLEGAVVNLLSNAIKYSPNGGPVRVTLRRTNTHAEVRVQDQGIGIAAEDLERIFEPFVRVRNQQTHRIEGSGLGLGIFKAIIEAHDGTVFVESTPGVGSTFGFDLPLNQHGVD